MKKIYTRISDREFNELKSYANSRGISVYHAIRELLLIGLLKSSFEDKLLRFIECYARVNVDFKFKLEKLLVELEEL